MKSRVKQGKARQRSTEFDIGHSMMHFSCEHSAVSNIIDYTRNSKEHVIVLIGFRSARGGYVPIGGRDTFSSLFFS